MLGQWALRGYGVFAVDHGGWSFAGIGRRAASGGMAGAGVGLLARRSTSWGRGIAAEAARAARDWAFATLGFDRLASFILPDNARSHARGGEAWGGARGDGGAARHPGGMVGASATREAPDMTALLTPDEPSPVRVLREDGRSDLLLTADHAGRVIPRRAGAARPAGQRTGPAYRLGHRHRRRHRTPVCRAGCHRGAADLFAPGDRLQSRPDGAQFDARR